MIMDQEDRRLWVELIIKCSKSVEEPLCDFLISELERGVIIEEGAEGGHDLLYIKAYLSREDLDSGALKAIEAYMKELETIHPDATLEIEDEKVVEEDWHDKWKEYFKPIKIGRHLVVKPSWEEYVPAIQDIVIEIDPGRAFGVGSHPSTRLVLQRLEHLSHEGLLEYAVVLDVGTGSGILAIAAAKLGAKEVMAIDNDPDAVETARDNVRLNHVHDTVSVSTTPVWDVEGPFDIVLANIDKDTLLLLSSDIAKQVKRGGRLLLSGILDTQVGSIKDVFCDKGLECMFQNQDGEDERWVMLEFLATG